MRSTISAPRLLTTALLTTSTFALLGLAVEGPPNDAIVPILPAIVEGPPNHGVVDTEHPPPGEASADPGLLGANLDLGVNIDAGGGENLPDVVGGVSNAVDGVTGTVGEVTDTVGEEVKPVVDVAEGVVDTATGAVDGIVDTATGVVDKVVDGATGLVDGVVDTATSVVGEVVEGATGVVASAVATASDVVDELLSAPSSIVDDVEDTASSIVSLVTSLVPLPTGTATKGLNITTATNTHSINGTTAISTATGVVHSAFTTIIISSIYITPSHTGSEGPKQTGGQEEVVYEGGLNDPTLDKPCWSEEECEETGSEMRGAHTLSVTPKGEEGSARSLELGVPILGAALAGVIGMLALL